MSPSPCLLSPLDQVVTKNIRFHLHRRSSLNTFSSRSASGDFEEMQNHLFGIRWPGISLACLFTEGKVVGVLGCDSGVKPAAGIVYGF